jgi:hypothetical protein
MWKFPIQQTDSSAITMIWFHIDMILNPFGNCPCMVRGTMVKNCCNLFICCMAFSLWTMHSCWWWRMSESHHAHF